MSPFPVVQWSEPEPGQEMVRNVEARWRSEAGWPPPARVVVADDTMRADTAFRLASEGTALLWRGDFQNARQLLQALQRRLAPSGKDTKKAQRGNAAPSTAAEPFHRYRMQQAQRARTLGRLLIPFDAGHGIPLRRAPDVRAACVEACGEAAQAYVMSLRELLGIIGAHEWRKNGIAVAALDARIHPHYGVFAPVRQEYVDLVAQVPLPESAKLAFDIGTGTGVLAAVLAKRGVARVIATENAPRAIQCARDNVTRLGWAERIEVVEADLFPESTVADRAPLIVCNPPWLPGKPSSLLEQAIYDPDSRMLRGFLNGLAARLTAQGEGWLVLSDLAEHLGLRSREDLLAMIETAGLRVIDRLDTKAKHPRVSDREDPLHAARTKEVTSLWRLAAV